MSITIRDDDLLEAVRTSSPDLRVRMLNDLLADFVKSDAKWPLAVSNQRQEVIAFLFPRPGLPGKSPPKLSPEREAEVNSRLRNLEDSRDLRDYIATLDSSGGSS